MFAASRVLFDAVIPVFVAGVAGAATLGGVLYETERGRRLLRLALIDERVSAAKLGGELAAARDIQLGMLPD